MLDWQQEKGATPIQESGEGLYPAPQRACLVCGKHQWSWNGKQYVCGSGDPTHKERDGLAWIYAGGLPKKVGRSVNPRYVTIVYRKQIDGTYVCTIDSNISLKREEYDFDMKVYLSPRRRRVYEHFTASAGDALHIDVYAGGGESTGMMGDLRVTEEAIVITSSEGSLHLQVVEDVSHRENVVGMPESSTD